MARDGWRCQAPAHPFSDAFDVDLARAAAAAVRCAGPLDPHHKATQGSHPEWAAKQWNIITLCRAHHDWVHANLERARLLGWYGAPDHDDIPPEGTP